MEAILAAIDIDGLATALQALFVGAVGVSLLFVGYRYAKKAMFKI
jgi:hypothetical protein